MAGSYLTPSLLSPPSHPLKHVRDNHLLFQTFSVAIAGFESPLRASKRYPNYFQEAVVVMPDSRSWVRDLGVANDDGDGDDDDSEEDEEDRSLDLLARFLENMFRKISRRVRKAVRSVLPTTISTKLVRFTVNGVLILAFLWTLKAFLEVICTVGSMVFTSILLVRVVWYGVSYTKDYQFDHMKRVDNNSDHSWKGAQPVG
ncbi:hypothetical protein AXF42_Ash013504 [Apostasia shenzhenica]|uniref:Uncharacterized protein n=1 Tax=Apostasia shenzhenica TaxID=1088818 RepID=A0A2I0A4E3_9ASPA|nr:hypothetical protein AXF42_Ash013504 [Apostasia shenzhenica]